MNKKKLAAIAAAAAMLVPGVAAFADEKFPPEGGTWHFGSTWNGSHAWSCYYHFYVPHGSSVRDGGNKFDRQDVGPNERSEAHIWDHKWHKAEAFYHIN